MEPATVKTTAPLTVRLYTSTVDAPAQRLASYTPVVDDKVAVVSFGAGLLVLGKVL